MITCENEFDGCVQRHNNGVMSLDTAFVMNLSRGRDRVIARIMPFGYILLDNPEKSRKRLRKRLDKGEIK